MDRLANARPGKRDRDLGQPFQPSCRTNRKMNLLHSRLRQTSIDPIGGRTRHQHMRPGMELCLNRHMIATDQTTRWIHEPGVGTPAVVEIRRRKVMPGTRARRAREYRAWARSLELIGQRPTPADCFKQRLVALVYFVYLVHLVSFVQAKTRQTRQTRQTKQRSSYAGRLFQHPANGDARAAARAARPTCSHDRAPVLS